MAVLNNTDRANISTELQRNLSDKREGITLTKSELRAAIDAVDQWIEDNKVAYNNALPVAARTNLTASQKAELLTFVANKRFKVGV